MASAHVVDNEAAPDQRFWPDALKKLPPVERVDFVAHVIAQAALEVGEQVVERDREGRCVTTDIYLLGLNAATRYKVDPVRAFTAADDLIRGCRDLVRGPKKIDWPNFTPWIPGSVVE